jgi:hypothetical protein
MGKHRHKNTPKRAAAPKAIPVKKKPIDLWLVAGAVAVGIIQQLIPGRTPVVVAIALIVIFILLFHPIWNFWWIEKSRLRQVVAMVIFATALTTFGNYVWPLTSNPRSEPNPLLRIEPERDILASSDGEFVLHLVNYGVDVDHVLVDQDYFVAQRFGDDIRIKLILNFGGATSPVVLRTNQSISIDVGFGRTDLRSNQLNIESAYKLAVRTNPVPSILGVRITATFRRFTDQKEFHVTGVFQGQRSDSGPNLMTLFGSLAQETISTINVAPEARAARLTLNDVMPYIESREHWSALTFKYDNGRLVSAQ